VLGYPSIYLVDGLADETAPRILVPVICEVRGEANLFADPEVRPRDVVREEPIEVTCYPWSENSTSSASLLVGHV